MSAVFDDQGIYLCTSNSTHQTTKQMKVKVDKLNTTLVLLKIRDTSASMTWKHLDHSRDYRINFKMVFDTRSIDIGVDSSEGNEADGSLCPVKPSFKSVSLESNTRHLHNNSELESLTKPSSIMSKVSTSSPPSLQPSSSPQFPFLSYPYTSSFSPSSTSSSSPPPTSSSSSVDIKNYMRMYTANDLTPGCKYEFCISLKLSESQHHTISCTTAVTKLSNQFYAVGFRNIGPTLMVVGGLMLAIFILIFSCGLGLTRRYDKRQVKRRIVTEDQFEANSSELYLAASVKENTMATEVYFENDAIVSSPDRSSPVFDQADIDEIWDSININTDDRYCESSFVSDPWRQDYYSGACCVETTCRTCGSNVLGVLTPVGETAKEILSETTEEE